MFKLISKKGAIVKRIVIMSAAALLLGAGFASAQNISGVLSGTLGPGTYIVVGDCQINAGDSLVVQPGTTFLHASSYEWLIYGKLIAVGTEADSIRFLRQIPDTIYDWRGLRFYNASSAASILEYCVIDHCSNLTRPGGGIYCNASGITIRHSTVSNCRAGDGGGIYALSSPIYVEHCKIFGNSTVNGPTADGNGGGIFLMQSNGAYVRNTELYNNHSSGA